MYFQNWFFATFSGNLMESKDSESFFVFVLNYYAFAYYTIGGHCLGVSSSLYFACYVAASLFN